MHCIKRGDMMKQLQSLRNTRSGQDNVGAKYWLSYAYLDKGMYREAIDSFQEVIRRGSDNPSNQIYLGASYAGAGEREKARAILKKLETSKEYVSPGELPVLYVALGEREKAFASFEKAYAAHDLQLQYLKVEPGFRPSARRPALSGFTAPRRFAAVRFI